MIPPVIRVVLGSKTVERATDIIAAAGIASWFTPELFQWLTSVNQIAALFLPIFGCAWLVVQIFVHLKTKLFSRKSDTAD